MLIFPPYYEIFYSIEGVEEKQTRISPPIDVSKVAKIHLTSEMIRGSLVYTIEFKMVFHCGDVDYTNWYFRDKNDRDRFYMEVLVQECDGLKKCLTAKTSMIVNVQ